MSAAVRADVTVPVFRDKYAKGWPANHDGEHAVYMPIGVAMSKTYGTDAHFCAYSVPEIPRRLATSEASAATRHIVAPDAISTPSGIYLQDEHGAPQLVTGRALAMMIKSAAASARVVVLNACYSDDQANSLRGVIDCVIGMTGAIHDDAARSFAVGFYRALGNRRSVGNAIDQAIATLAAKQLPDEHLPRCRTHDGVDAYQIILGAPA